MTRRLYHGTFAAVALLLLAVPLLAQGQTTPPAKHPSQKDCDIQAPTDKNCADPSPAQPSGTSSTPPAAQEFPYPGDAPAPSTPAANAAGKRFPYPGDATASGADSSSSSGTRSSSSSNSSSSSSSADPDDPLAPDSAASQPPGRRKLPKVTKLQNDDDREAEDVKVAKFYDDVGNNLAAYNRLKDATRLISNDPDAWYLLGKVAAQMGKPSESLSAYQQFLKVETGTRRSKELLKAQPELRAAR